MSQNAEIEELRNRIDNLDAEIIDKIAELIRISKRIETYREGLAPMWARVVVRDGAQGRGLAQTDDGEILGIRHRKHPVMGVQFHPESILMTEGKKIITNFLEM